MGKGVINLRTVYAVEKQRKRVVNKFKEEQEDKESRLEREASPD